MIFNAKSKDIEQLDPNLLVELMRRLVRLECRQFNIPLRSISISDQITVKDGGEDGRVHWDSEVYSTNYFPSNFCIFQSKAKKRLWDSDVKKEVVRNQDGKNVVNAAIREILERNGDYVLFCSKALGEQEIIKRKKAICGAVRECGRTPNEKKIHIYDANKISDWVNTHPSVAIWLASIVLGRSLEGFQTHAMWGEEFSMLSWVDSGQSRFSIENNLFRSNEEEANKLCNFDKISSLAAKI